MLNNLNIKTFDLIPRYKFYVDFSSVDFLLSYGIVSKELSDVVKSCELPSLDMTEGEEINIGLYKRKTTGKVDIDNFYIEFYATEIAENFSNAWKCQQFNPSNGAKYPPNKYERDIVLYLYDRTVDLYTVTASINPLFTDYLYKITYFNCFPLSTEKLRLDNNEEDYLEGINVVFAVNGGMMIEQNDLIDFNNISFGRNVSSL
jgi:hypothetical protein